jgi:hypothetical protein
MRIPTLQGVIRRRLLLNYRLDPDVARRRLPAPLRPKLHDGYAIAGICLIRLEQIRPRYLPKRIGLHSENAAQRIAVEWTDDEGNAREGVFISRRDTSSLVNHYAGGRLFPGEHRRARFKVTDCGRKLSIDIESFDGAFAVSVTGRVAQRLPPTSVFRTLDEAS